MWSLVIKNNKQGKHNLTFPKTIYFVPPFYDGFGDCNLTSFCFIWIISPDDDVEELIKQGRKSKFICGKREIVKHILRTFYQFSGFTCKDLSFVP